MRILLDGFHLRWRRRNAHRQQPKLLSPPDQINTTSHWKQKMISKPNRGAMPKNSPKCWIISQWINAWFRGGKVCEMEKVIVLTSSFIITHNTFHGRFCAQTSYYNHFHCSSDWEEIRLRCVVGTGIAVFPQLSNTNYHSRSNDQIKRDSCRVLMCFLEALQKRLTQTRSGRSLWGKR